MNEAIHGITAEKLLRSFPLALRSDPASVCLASVIAQMLAARPAEIDTLRIYADIDRLPEPLLDMLAHDFKVDWWDANYSLPEKRQTLKDSWRVHRRLGTKWAIKTALGVVFPGAIIEEWFQYEDGLPYHFRIRYDIPPEGISQDRLERAVSRVWYYKNLRSHCDGITFLYEDTARPRIAAFARAAVETEIFPQITVGSDTSGSSGAAAAASAMTETEVFPQITVGSDTAGATGVAGHTASFAETEVFPQITVGSDVAASSGTAGGMSVLIETEIWPALVSNIQMNVTAAVQSAVTEHQKAVVLPENTE